MQTKTALAFTTLCAALFFSAAAEAQGSDLTAPGSFRLAVGGTLGFAGNMEATRDDVSVGFDQEVTFGGEVQGLVPIGDMFFVGGSFAARSIGIDAPNLDRNTFLAFDGVFGFRYPIDLGSIGLEPFASIRLGLAIATPTNEDGDEADFGIDSGVRVGTNIWFMPMVGAYVSMGYQRGDFFPEGVDHLRSHEFALDMGVTLRLGS